MLKSTVEPSGGDGLSDAEKDAALHKVIDGICSRQDEKIDGVIRQLCEIQAKLLVLHRGAA